ncbi:DNA uptake protein [Frankia canadensis]|uniref:DNA uptake protein n=1 Tax=Frankia canadensis TaxID=1836972 RepID=A0A2I2KML7_9ACTN|nr:ComEA family DNA-binding protein [Frankia canadensis]SNQ46892.1 DNA uptake protein [Frankia canadensis]SOU54182.1 DNA uptake protein [Frankia canadensis]
MVTVTPGPGWPCARPGPAHPPGPTTPALHHAAPPVPLPPLPRPARDGVPNPPLAHPADHALGLDDAHRPGDPPVAPPASRVRAGYFADDGDLSDEEFPPAGPDPFDHRHPRDDRVEQPDGDPFEDDFRTPGEPAPPAAEHRVDVPDPTAGGYSIRARLAERLPMSLRAVVATPAASATLVLALVALSTAVMATWLAWQHRPVPIAAPASTSSLVVASAGAADGPVARAAGAATPRPSGSAAGSSASAGAGGEVVVDVAGRVTRPGVVRLPAGARVVDAIDRAGGVLPGTDTTGIALARILVDGEQVLVDGRPGSPPAAVPPPAGGSDGSAGGGAGGTSGAGAASGGPLDLNSASAQQLDGLPGVGPVLAQRIVDWRAEHGPFRSPEQLGEVSGVGDRRLADLLPLVRV